MACVAILKQLEGIADHIARRLVPAAGNSLGYQPLEFWGQGDVHSDSTVAETDGTDFLGSATSLSAGQQCDETGPARPRRKSHQAAGDEAVRGR